jgi:hypothetical protein
MTIIMILIKIITLITDIFTTYLYSVIPTKIYFNVVITISSTIISFIIPCTNAEVLILFSHKLYNNPEHYQRYEKCLQHHRIFGRKCIQNSTFSEGAVSLSVMLAKRLRGEICAAEATGTPTESLQQICFILTCRVC